jgi:pyruvate,water dikinase
MEIRARYGRSPSAARGGAEESAFGGKAVSLGAAIRAGLPVPPGIALGTAMVERVASGDESAIDAILTSPTSPMCGWP